MELDGVGADGVDENSRLPDTWNSPIPSAPTFALNGVGANRVGDSHLAPLEIINIDFVEML